MDNSAIEYIYYNLMWGCIPEGVGKKEIDITRNTIEYMLESGLDKDTVFDIVQNMPAKDFITPNDIPDSAWNTKESLLKRNKFYYNKLLRIVSDPPKLNMETGKIETKKLSIEMKIVFTMDEVYNYYITRFPSKINNKSKTIGALKFMLNNYDGIVKDVEAIDILLCVIDTAYNVSKVDKTFRISGPFDMKEIENEVIENMEQISIEAEIKNMNKIIWRS